MILELYIDNETIPVEIDNDILSGAKSIFDKMDTDMDNGMQMHREWVDSLNAEQRCQLAADKILTAIENENDKLLKMMSAYILYKVPGIKGMRIVHGDMCESELVF